ncbi:MAG: hypothetical protein ACXQTN_02150, partial [Methanoculleaceae archaeon]
KERLMRDHGVNPQKFPLCLEELESRCNHRDRDLLVISSKPELRVGILRIMDGGVSHSGSYAGDVGRGRMYIRMILAPGPGCILMKKGWEKISQKSVSGG